MKTVLRRKLCFGRQHGLKAHDEPSLCTLQIPERFDMRSHVRLLIAVLALVTFVVVLVGKQPSVATADSHPERKGAVLCRANVARSTGSAIHSSSAFGSGQGHAARLPWDGILSRSALSLFDQLLDRLPESLPSSSPPVIFEIPEDRTPAVTRNRLAPAQTVNVFVSSNFFSPQMVRIQAGDTVRWNWSASLHTVTSGSCVSGSYGDSCAADDVFCSPNDLNCSSGPTSITGAVYSHTFNSPGTFAYFCRIHGPIGMTGTVIVDPASSPPTTLQFSATSYNVGEGGASAVVTVARSGDTSGASTVDFATSDGSATQNSDYIVASGTLSFAATETSKTFNVLIVDDAFVEANETINLTLSNATGATLAAPSTATITISDNDTAGSTSPAPKRFACSLNGAQETPPNNSLPRGTGLVLLNQSETSAVVGLLFQNLSSAETAAHIHGNGGPGVAAPILFPLPTTNPVINFTINPTALQVADLKAGLHYQNVHSTNFAGGEIRGQLGWNPTLEENFLIRQQYLDFLSRDGDPDGFNFWVGTITPCQADAQCFHDRTIAAADAFFFEPEFQQTAGFVFRGYRAAYGNTQPFPNPDNSNPAEANKLVDYSVYVADRARVVGGANLAAAQQAFANLFVSRTEFTNRYAAGLTGPQFVDAILATMQNADGIDLTAQRQALIDQYNNAGGGNAGRGMVLYRLADDNAQSNPINNRAFIDAEYNRQFALTLYFGYLRRNPDIGGFLFWQSQINSAPIRDVAKQNALVCSFVTAAEYQLRFGPNAPRTNAECPQ